MSLGVTKNYATGVALTKAHLDTAFDSIESWSASIPNEDKQEPYGPFLWSFRVGDTLNNSSTTLKFTLKRAVVLERVTLHSNNISGTLRVQVQDDTSDVIDEGGLGYIQVANTTEATTEDILSAGDIAAESQNSIILTETATANVDDGL